ncbi:MAG: ATP-binding cassette domain-containing protein [Gammaproteobacteria bacterium]|nr:ATP-binding cassette domain-containing protein [Gammaproteobacteria bacterium]
MELMINIEKLTKDFGPFRAVDDISFEVKKGEVLGFLGPNGAGKSTTMKMITGFITPTKGDAKICGESILDAPISVKQKIGYLPEGAPAYPDMTPFEFLHFIAEIRGFTGEDANVKVNNAIKKVNLESVIHKPIDNLSKGFKRRVGLAQTILHDPEILIMDEPTDGLDPNQKHEVRELIKQMAKEKAIVVSTHILEEVHAVCSRAIIIAQGKILFDGTPDELSARSSFHNAVNLLLETKDDALAIEAKLNTLSHASSVEHAAAGDNLIRFFVKPKKGVSILNDVNELAASNHWTVKELHVMEGQLDEVFRDITTSSSDAKGVQLT